MAPSAATIHQFRRSRVPPEANLIERMYPEKKQ
jgi:hypothetical protein